mgnify:CR=1 FL=1
MSTLKVDAIRHNSATSDAITTSSDGTCTAKLTSVGGGQLSHRNLVINGAMLVAQRGVSSTSAGYLIDRFEAEFTGLDESPTYAQVDVASGTTPYTLGFRKALKITNGNQTSGAGTSQRFQIFMKLEGQDVANSGWNYKDPNSFITLQFWIKSSVAQNFYGYLRTKDGTGQNYKFETGSLSADTWTKITKTIPGNSNITIDNDTGEGLQLNLSQYFGTNYSDSGVTLNSWGAHASGTRTLPHTTTWYTTNDATLEYTGVQIEVGNHATSFEHRSFGEELELCKRYYQQVYFYWNTGSTNSNYLYYVGGQFHPVMRAAPSLVAAYDNNNENSFETRDGGTWRTGLPSLIEAQPEGIVLRSNNNVVFNAIKGIAHFNAEI